MELQSSSSKDIFQWTQLFWFDTNELPDTDDEEIISAELRMYKQGKEKIQSKLIQFGTDEGGTARTMGYFKVLTWSTKQFECISEQNCIDIRDLPV